MYFFLACLERERANQLKLPINSQYVRVRVEEDVPGKVGPFNALRLWATDLEIECSQGIDLLLYILAHFGCTFANALR